MVQNFRGCFCYYFWAVSSLETPKYIIIDLRTPPFLGFLKTYITIVL